MLRDFYLLEPAELERDQAIEWYEGERQGLGLQFFERYETAVQHALRFPESGSLVTDRRLVRDVRRHVFDQFPYDLITTVAREQLVVVAVAHHKRRPGYWRKRLVKVFR
jgi:toxin ParE1/3/4